MNVYILDGARTPFAVWSRGTTGAGAPGGALKELDPFDLGAAALRGALARAAVRSVDVERVVFANMYQVGPHGCYGARYVSYRAEIPAAVPSVTVSMACGSGLSALSTAASAIREGAGIVGAGGTDCPSQIRRDVFIPSFEDISCGKAIGKTLDDMAREFGVSRGAQDAWALRSHRAARDAIRAGRLSAEIVETFGVREDDAVLAVPTPAPFQAASPLFGEGGTVTKANTHAFVDGASALILASEEGARKAGHAPLGRFVSGAYVGTPPERMGYASVPAIRKALDSAQMSVKDIDLFEINETFAAQMLIDIKELGLPEDRVNVNGGSIALGHPFAGTGCRLVHSLLLELRRHGLKRGVASICVGGGQGVASVVETV